MFTLDIDDWLAIVLVLLGLAVLAFTSIAEAVLNSIAQPHARVVIEKGPARTSPLSEVLKRPRLAASALTVARGAAVVVVAISGILLATELFPAVWWTVAAAAVVIVFVSAFIEVTFRTLAGRDLETAAHVTSGATWILVGLLAPAGKLFELLADLVVPGRNSLDVPEGAEEQSKDTPLLTTMPGDEPRREEEKDMIKGVFGLEDTTVSQVMVPRVDIAAIEASTPFDEAVKFIIEQGYSRIPLYQETIDSIVGIIYAKDLLNILRSGIHDANLKTIAHDPLFVPEYKKIDELLREFREKRLQIAIVVDEYGGTAGLISLEDLLEQIVGNIEDEYDTAEREIEMVGEHEAVVDAKVGIADINDLFNQKIEATDFDTVGGLLSARLGRIPVVGDAVQAGSLTFAVLSTVGRRPKKVRVVVNPVPGEGAQPD